MQATDVLAGRGDRLAAVIQCLGAGLELFHHLDPDGPAQDSLTDALRVMVPTTGKRP